MTEKRTEAVRQFTASTGAFSSCVRLTAIAFYSMALSMEQVAAVVAAMDLLPHRVPLRVAFWRWVVLWVAVVLLVLWGAS